MIYENLPKTSKDIIDISDLARVVSDWPVGVVLKPYMFACVGPSIWRKNKYKYMFETLVAYLGQQFDFSPPC